MTFQEILQGIMRHRASPVASSGGIPLPGEIERKVGEIEWVLIVLAEKLAEGEKP